MRYRDDAMECDSRKDPNDYKYYSYKFIGIKPTSYSPFEVNGAGRNDLLRSLTMICDMCLVDLVGDVAGSGEGSVNMGNRQKLIFASPSSSNGSGNDSADDSD